MRRGILRGASWTTLAQFVPLVVNIVMTPYIINSFGIPRYGVFILASTIVVFLGSFDGGIANSVARWSAVYAGTDDRAATTRLMTTMFVIVSVIGVVLFVLLYAFASTILGLFGVPSDLRDESAFLLRSMAIVLGLSQIRGLFAAQLSARQQYGWVSMTSIISYCVYAAGLILSVQTGSGLRGAAITFLGQTAAATLLIIPRGAAFLSLRDVGLMAMAELRSFLRYSLQVQATGLTSIVNTQADTFIVGKVLDVSAIAIYGAGSSFALQLRNVPVNALGPMMMSLSAAFGEGGRERAVETFTRLQRPWVQACSGWCAVALGASYFGVSSWLGPRFELSGVVACLLMAAHAVNLWTGGLTVLLSAVGRPEIETRYITTSVVVNVLLTIPGVLFFGVLGTVLATALGNIIGSLYLVRIAKRRFDPSIRSFVREVPVIPSIVALIVVVLLESAVHPLVPNGALGLLLCGVVAAPGLLVFALCLLGPRRVAEVIRSRSRRTVT